MTCLICRNEIICTNLLCYICWSNINFLKIDKASAINSLVIYNSTIRQLIHIFKYKSPWQIKKIFVNWISLMCNDILSDAEIILSVPMHKLKLISRGYNQMIVLCNEISQVHKKHFIKDGLEKIRNITSQSVLSQRERLINIKDSLRINPKRLDLLKGKKILIIDDVMTTGATLAECVQTLGNIPASIKCLSIARTDL